LRDDGSKNINHLKKVSLGNFEQRKDTKV